MNRRFKPHENSFACAGPGLRSIIDSIDVRDDFKTFMQQYAISWQMSGQKGPRRDGPGEDSYVSSSALGMSRTGLISKLSCAQPAAQRPPPSPTQASSNHVHQTFSRPTFGVDLGDQMLRDSVEVPRILEKCFEAVEAHGLDSMGIYRLSGTTSRVQRLKSALDRGEADMNNNLWARVLIYVLLQTSKEPICSPRRTYRTLTISPL